MAKYGVFRTSGGKNPLQEYEGDFMLQDKQFVKIYKQDPNKGDLLVAAIHLDKGESVKEIAE